MSKTEFALALRLAVLYSRRQASPAAFLKKLPAGLLNSCQSVGKLDWLLVTLHAPASQGRSRSRRQLFAHVVTLLQRADRENTGDGQGPNPSGNLF